MMLAGNFHTPYFWPGQDKKWYASAESVPGPTTERMQVLCQETHDMVMIVPIYEKEQPPGVLYNTAAVIDADGTYLGKVQKKSYSAYYWILGKVLLSNRATWDTLFFKPSTLRLVFTFVMTDIFQTARVC